MWVLIGFRVSGKVKHNGRRANRDRRSGPIVGVGPDEEHLGTIRTQGWESIRRHDYDDAKHTVNKNINAFDWAGCVNGRLTPAR